MNIQALRYILAIDQYHSINRAAQNMYISQSTMSRVVKEMEEQIGITLFIRTNKGIVTTENGRRFLEQARHLVQEIDRLELAYFYSSIDEQDTLMVATQRCSVVVSALINYYNRYCAGRELLNMVLHEATMEEVIRTVCSGTYGVGVVHYTSDREETFLQKLKDTGLEYHPLDRTRVSAQVRRGHPLLAKETVTTDMLDAYPHVAYSDEDVTNIKFCSNVSQYNPGILKKRIVIQDRASLLDVLKNTDAYYVGSNFSKYSLDVTSDRCYIPLADVPYTLNTVWIHRGSRVLTKSEKRFCEGLEEMFLKMKEETP